MKVNGAFDTIMRNDIIGTVKPRSFEPNIGTNVCSDITSSHERALNLRFNEMFDNRVRTKNALFNTRILFERGKRRCGDVIEVIDDPDSRIVVERVIGVSSAVRD